MIRFIPGMPALIANGILVLGDIHIGLEHEMSNKGLRLGPAMGGMLARILQVAGVHKPKRILLLGDIKHNVPGTHPDERRDVSEFLEELCGIARLTIVPGNHDGGIGKLVGNRRLKTSKSSGAVLNGMGFFHGHSWPSQDVLAQESIFMAHQHPCIEIRDTLGSRNTVKAWCIGGLSGNVLGRYPKANLEAKVILVPAFNPLLCGGPLNREGWKPLGPIMRNKMFKLEDSQIYLLDGTPMGRLSGLPRVFRGSEEGLHGKKKRKRSDSDLRRVRKEGQEDKVS